jgi:hypothetical protein
LLVRIEHALGWLQLEDFDVRAQSPSMRGGTVKQLSLCLRQRNLKITLACARAFQKILEGHSGFAGAWLAFDEEKTAPRKTALTGRHPARQPRKQQLLTAYSLNALLSLARASALNARLCHKQTFSGGFSVKG